ncbi:MAG TPA: hypothetical protein VIL72_10860 [Beijerinckiaceae bacterium]|jgi:hypothetical protein
MDRRNFMRALFALGGAGVVASTIGGRAEAATLLDELKAMETAPQADLPAEGAADSQYYYYRRRRPWRRRRVRRCFWTRNRWGRPVRRCVIR